MLDSETLDDVANLLRPYVISARKVLCLRGTVESEEKVNLPRTIVSELGGMCVE
jgi:hypothetical protein